MFNFCDDLFLLEVWYGGVEVWQTCLLDLKILGPARTRRSTAPRHRETPALPPHHHRVC